MGGARQCAVAVAVAMSAGSVSAQSLPTSPPGNSTIIDTAGPNRATIFVRPDGTVVVQATVPVVDLAARLRALLPDPTVATVTLSTSGADDRARLDAIDDALRIAGITAVRTSPAATLDPVPAPHPPRIEPVVAKLSWPIMVKLDAKGTVSIGSTSISLDSGARARGELASDLIDFANGNRRTPIYIVANPQTAYGDMLATIDALRAAGFEHVGILTEPAMPKPPAGP